MKLIRKFFIITPNIYPFLFYISLSLFRLCRRKLEEERNKVFLAALRFVSLTLYPQEFVIAGQRGFVEDEKKNF